MAAGTIRVGIGGWTFPPWRNGTFYPAGLAQKRELEFASRAVTAIEINGTYHGTQKPESFAAWADTAPAGFVFTVKASKFTTLPRVLAGAGESIERFLGSGITRLGDRLGPILWQFMGTKRFDPDDFAAWLALLPESRDGLTLRHAIQVRHESFHTPEFVTMCRDKGAAIVFGDSPQYPAIADITADFVYAHLERGEDDHPLCYPGDEIDRWTAAARTWAEGGRPGGLPYVTEGDPPRTPRDTFLFFIHGGKVHAPAGARAIIAGLDAAGAP